MRGKGIKGLCTPIGDIGERGTGEGVIGVVMVPLVMVNLCKLVAHFKGSAEPFS
jgi:hypothetical protein